MQSRAAIKGKTVSKEVRQEVSEYFLKAIQAYGQAPVVDAFHYCLKLGVRVGADSAEPRRFKPAQIKRAWLRKKGRCNRCNEPLALDQAVGDHIEPWSQGGKTSDENCAAIHPWCNSAKSDNDLLTDSKKTGNMFNETLPAED